MKITDLWSLHYQSFVIQIEGTQKEANNLKKALEQTFSDKVFFIVLKGGDEYAT